MDDPPESYHSANHDEGVVMDPQVLGVQVWLNEVYEGTPGFFTVPETGLTGWSTMFALTRALQIELGVSPPSNNFGPGTTAAVDAIGPIDSSFPWYSNIVQILQSALWCKGYNAGVRDGIFGANVTAAVESVQGDLGIPRSGVVNAKLFKSLLTMDAYIRVGSGTNPVRQVQRWMNATYLTRAWFDIIPTDGRYSRDVQKALVYAIQEELSVAGANGNYGPGTRAAVQSAPIISAGSSDGPSQRWVRLFECAMRFNGIEGTFDGTFTTLDRSALINFQNFCVLSATGTSNYETWSSLLVSNGDPNRKGQAADCSTTVTAARAQALVQDGRVVIGRYLTNVDGSSFNKKIQPGELATIFNAGLRVFPIYQTTATHTGYFTRQQGFIDAQLATNAAAGYGFARGTHIYFAVDYDALDGDINGPITEYFQALNERMRYLSSPYRVAIYGARNVCSTLSNKGLATRSFVSGMSTGFSGNLGFPLPQNWAYDQISTISIGTGGAQIEIDNNIYSGRDPGVSAVTPQAEKLDVPFDFDQLDDLAHDVRQYCTTVNSNTLGLRHGLPDDCVTVLMQHDELLTSLSRSYGIRKALIQTVSFWEYWKTTWADVASDQLVVDWHHYQDELDAWQPGDPHLPEPGIVIEVRDSSTGFAQIRAETAINAWNWRLTNGLATGSPIDPDDRHQLYAVWVQLRSDVVYNLSAVPGVLMWGADDIGVIGMRLDYTPTEVQSILARYNGTGANAVLYGTENKGVYDIFEAYNAALRA